MITRTTEGDMFLHAVSVAIKKEIEEATTKAIEDAKRELEEKIPDIVASVSLRIFHSLRYERMGTELGIFIKIEGLQ